ncbi:hypothetical protein CHS0354_023512 [Potamilus streckersoni]|uniref:DUF7064 domain-containing protein n=1 Tax=Potamilus streckersoni TaxID=2493646 RepID=A0AAE0VJK7_9BIVA|nr:hypothetical protein CHS0354_023512 [Potamilus streckersoni]
MYYSIILTLFVGLIVKWLFRIDPKPINGIYSQPSKWYPLKYALFYIILWLRKRQNSKEQQVRGENAGYGRKSRNTVEDMDRIQELPPDQPKAVDAVYFTGSNAEGQFLVAATARRQNNIVQTIVYLRLPEIGLLELPALPDTTLEGTKENEYAAGGLHIFVVEPMKKWKIKYDGELLVQETGEVLEVHFDLDWNACTKYFDFDTDLHPRVLADAIAREKWSRKFFDTLKQSHQTHYEQFGDTTGVVQIKGREDIKVKIRGVRDHTYGKVRDWKLLHRYGLQYISCEDGKTICIGAVSMPITTSRLTIGYIFHPDGRMDAVTSSEFEFYKFGDDGRPPTEFSFKFTAGGVSYELQVKVIQTAVFYIGDDRDAKIHERFAHFQVNGVTGYGLSEWEYCIKNKDPNECHLMRSTKNAVRGSDPDI